MDTTRERAPTRSPLGAFADRVRDGVRRGGVLGLTRVLAQRARKAAHLRERHVWYALDLARPPARALPEGLTLVQAGSREVELVARLPGAGGVPAAERSRDQGADLWLVLDGRDPAFACWIYPTRTPVMAARGGWLALPEGVVCLEDSVTSPAHRGRGIAPAAWSGIADAAARSGAHTMITKVAEDNAPSRRAVEKGGFREVALMHLVRTAGRTRVEIAPRAGEPQGEILARRLRR